jgi:prepilin-type N-terminal cleavage/methylation domain-containing protein
LTPRSGFRHSEGFTLVEVLLVLALVGVITGLVAGNVGAFITGAQFEPPDRVLKKAILDAIYESSESKRATYLSFETKSSSFRVTDRSGTEIHSHSIYKEELDDGKEVPKVVFKAIGPESGPDGGSTIYDEDELILTRIPFHYGSSVPFEVEIEFKDQLSRHRFDPFSGFVLKSID